MTDGVGFVAGLKICGGAATASLGRSGRGTENKSFMKHLSFQIHFEASTFGFIFNTFD